MPNTPDIETVPDDAPLRAARARVEGLRNVRGAMVVQVQGNPVGALIVDDGRAEFVPGASDGQATAEFDDVRDLRRMLRGELNPVVAALQRRVLMSGDSCLCARIILGIRSGAAFSPVTE